MDLAHEHWRDLDGWATARQIDLGDLPVGRFTNLVYYWWTEGADPKEVEKFERRLYIPPKNVVAKVGPWSAEAETAAFAAAKAALTGK